MKNICLVIHCIRQKSSPEPQIHRELFISRSDIENLIINLKEEGYCFKLPGNIGQSDGPVCSLTFDDGYFNNQDFLEVAEKYNIPFILFLTFPTLSFLSPKRPEDFSSKNSVIISPVSDKPI